MVAIEEWMASVRCKTFSNRYYRNWFSIWKLWIKKWKNSSFSSQTERKVILPHTRTSWFGKSSILVQIGIGWRSFLSHTLLLPWRAFLLYLTSTFLYENAFLWCYVLTCFLLYVHQKPYQQLVPDAFLLVKAILFSTLSLTGILSKCYVTELVDLG